MDIENLKHMEEISPTRALFKMGIPSMIGMLVSALYNLADAFFIGRLGTDQVGAIGVTFPITQVVIGIGMTFGVGAASYISRLLGQKKYQDVNQTASTAIFTLLAFQIPVILISLVFLKPLLLSLGATETILPYAREYALIYLSGTIISVFYVAMNNIVTAEGNARLTMIAMLLGTGLNILLDPIFIYQFQWGIKGAAWATVFSQAVTAGLYIFYLIKGKGPIRISPKYIRIESRIYKEIFSVGMPIFLFQLLFGISQGMTNNAARAFGSSAVVSVGIVIRILSLGTFVIYGFTKGFQPLAGYAYGARDYNRLKALTLQGLKWTSLFCLIFTTLIVFFSMPVMKWFSRDSQVIFLGMKMLEANGMVFLFFGFQIIISTLFLALGRGGKGGILSISRNGLAFIPTILLAPKLMGIKGVLYAQVIADSLTILLTLILAKKLSGQLTKEFRSREKEDRKRGWKNDLLTE